MSDRTKNRWMTGKEIRELTIHDLANAMLNCGYPGRTWRIQTPKTTSCWRPMTQRWRAF
jgi:hypothetical protein